jgi:hypothetical protein
LWCNLQSLSAYLGPSKSNIKLFKPFSFLTFFVVNFAFLDPGQDTHRTN